MPRRREVPKANHPDPKFKDKLVSKFTNTIMQTQEGHRRGSSTAPSTSSASASGGCPRGVPQGARQHEAEAEVKSRARRGATYQVPVEVARAPRPRWHALLVTYARERGEKNYARAPGRRARRRGNGRGNAVKKKDDSHKDGGRKTKHSRTTAGRARLSAAFHAKQTQENARAMTKLT